MKKLIRLCEYLLFLFFIGIIIFTTKKLTTLLIIPLILLLYFFNKKINIKNYALFIFITALIVRLISIFILKVDITDDFKTMYDASRSLINGNLDFMNGFYFKTYPYQLGLVLYQALLLKIFNNVIILKIMNSIISSLIVLFIYLISKNIFKEKSARIISLTYIFYLYPLYLNSVLTNQHIQILIVLIAIYLLLNKKESIKLFVFISILLGIANIFRTESIVIILGIVLYNIAFMTKKNYKNKIKYILTLLITYFAFTNITTLALNMSPLYNNDKSNQVDKNVTIWKFYCGLSTKHNGIYNEEDVVEYFNTTKEKELLISRIKEDKLKFPVLFIKKEVILWSQTNYDLRILNDFNSNLFNFLLNFNQGLLNMVLLFFVIGIFPDKSKETKKEILFIKLLIGIYFGIYLFIEISPRYAYILHILIFLILPLAIEKIESFIENRRKKI